MVLIFLNFINSSPGFVRKSNPYFVQITLTVSNIYMYILREKNYFNKDRQRYFCQNDAKRYDTFFILFIF